MQKEKLPAQMEEKEFLTSSNSLPSFDTIQDQYAELLTDIDLAEKPGKKKKEKGELRKSAIQEDDSTPEEISPDDIEDVIAFPLNAWFTRVDKPVLSKVERKSLALSMSRLLNKYLPKASSKWKEEFGFLMCAGTIFLMRVEVPEDKEEDKKSDDKKPSE